jgi:hypothetical protein
MRTADILQLCSLKFSQQFIGVKKQLLDKGYEKYKLTFTVVVVVVDVVEVDVVVVVDVMVVEVGVVVEESESVDEEDIAAVVEFGTSKDWVVSFDVSTRFVVVKL